MHKGVTLSLIGVWILLSLAGKGFRYSAESETASVRGERLAKTFLVERGWLPVQRMPLTHGDTYVATIYAKGDCSQKIAVAVLGAVDEIKDVLFQNFGQDVAFLENGRQSESPWIDLFVSNAYRFLYWKNLNRFVPILAVAPAPSPEASEDACDPPSLREWARISEIP